MFSTSILFGYKLYCFWFEISYGLHLLKFSYIVKLIIKLEFWHFRYFFSTKLQHKSLLTIKFCIDMFCSIFNVFLLKHLTRSLIFDMCVGLIIKLCFYSFWSQVLCKKKRKLKWFMTSQLLYLQFGIPFWKEWREGLPVSILF